MTIAEKKERLRQRLSPDTEPEITPVDAAAEQLAEEVRSGLESNRVWMAVSALMDRFDFASFTPGVKRTMEEALHEAGFEISPGLTYAQRSDVVCLSLPSHNGSDAKAAMKVKRLVPGSDPMPFNLGDRLPQGSILWLDVDLQQADTKALKRQLRELRPRPTPQMVQDLLQPDKLPNVKRYEEDAFRAVSCFAIRAVEFSGAESEHPDSKAGRLQLQPLELLASERWIVSCWHGTNECKGIDERPTDAAVVDRAQFHKAIGRRWRRDHLTKTGDVGLAILLELVCEYPEARRVLYTWHESWEMDFYNSQGTQAEGHEEVERRTLVELRGLVSVLNRSISPLDASTLESESYWFEDVDKDLASRVGTTLERSLLKLHELSDALRNDFDLVHLRLSQRQAEKTERLQLGLQVVAGALVLPALVVSGFSANTELFPGHDVVSGLTVMIAAMVVAAALSFLFFNRVIDMLRRRSRRQAAT